MKKTIKWGKISIIFVFILSVIMLNILGVSDTDAKVRINKRKITIYVGNTLQLKMLGTKKKVKWSSNKKKIATVTKKGKIKGVKAGKAVITAKIGVKKYSCTVTVKNIAISKTSIELKVGKKSNLKVLGNKKKVTWYSDDNSIAVVNKNGIVKAMKPGVTIINAKIGKKLYCCVVVVKDNHTTATPVQSTTIIPKVTDSVEEISSTPLKLTPETAVTPDIFIESTIKPEETNASIKTTIPSVAFPTGIPIETAITMETIVPTRTIVPARTIVPIETVETMKTTTPKLTATPIVTMPNVNPYLTKTVYVSKEENIEQINFVLPENWTNKTQDKKSTYQAYFPKQQDKTVITSGVLVGTWEKGVIEEETLEQFIQSRAGTEMEKMRNAGWKDVSVDISSSKMDIGNVVVSFWKIPSNHKVQTMLVYDVIVDGYLVEVEIGDVQDNIEPNVYDVGRNIVNSLRVIK